MIFTYQTSIIGNIHIYISQAKYENTFKVSAVKVNMWGDAKRITETTYADIKKAQKRFSYLISKAEKGEL